MKDIETLIMESKSGNKTASETLIQENSGLIWSVAKHFIGRGVETDDLYQLGCLGFLKAVDGFDPEYGTQFSTYAVPKIAGEIRRYLRDDGALKVSRSVKERSVKIKNVRNQLLHIFGREPTITEIAKQTGFTLDEIVIAETATANVESINQQTGDEGFALENILSDSEDEEMLLEKISLRQAISLLPEKEATVIRLRYFHGLTQDRISRVLSVSQVQVSRIEKKAIAMLRDFMK